MKIDTNHAPRTADGCMFRPSGRKEGDGCPSHCHGFTAPPSMSDTSASTSTRASLNIYHYIMYHFPTMPVTASASMEVNVRHPKQADLENPSFDSFQKRLLKGTFADVCKRESTRKHLGEQ